MTVAKPGQSAEDTNGATQDLPRQTEPGTLIGTIGYMSPEQLKGHPADHSSDIFAFSMILYEMLTGKPTFHKPSSAETMSAILYEDPPAIAQLAPNTPLSLQRVLDRGLQKDPKKRFHSASDLAFALEASSDTAIPLPSGVHAPENKRTNLRAAIVAAALAILLGGGTVAYLWARPTPLPTVSNYVQITHDGGQKSLIGTDGSRLYMSLGTAGAQGISAIPISGGEETNIPMPSSGTTPVGLSPDGSQFLAVDGHGVPATGPLWSLPILGGSPRRLGEAVAENAAWSPDGKTLAYTNGGDLFLANADGTQPRKLLSMTNLVSNPVWSPNGRHLRFDTSEGFGTTIGHPTLWETTVDGAPPQRLLAGWHTPPDECCGSWTADGRYFIFQAQGQIWALAQKRGFLQQDVKPIPLTSSPMSLNSPLPGKDGTRLFVVGRSYRGELTRFDLNSGQPTPYLNGISAEYLDFSKDGQWVAYVSYPEAALWRSKVDGTQRLQLTFPPLAAVLPRWSPDGKSIVFFEFPRSFKEPARILEVSPDGGTPHELMPNDPHNQQDPNWSPDGNKIVFAGDANDAAVAKAAPAIRVLDLQTHQVSTLPGSQGLFSPRWSPDGRYIAALTDDSSTVMLGDLHTQQWTEVAKGTLGWLNWSKDGDIYALDFTGKGAVVRIRMGDNQTGNKTGNKPARKAEPILDLKDFVPTGRFAGSLALTPDGSPLLVRDRGTQDVYALDWNEP
jgi:Tol biopolymer transport system component